MKPTDGIVSRNPVFRPELRQWSPIGATIVLIMSEPAQCDECQSILEEIKKAIEEIKIRAGRESRLSPPQRENFPVFTGVLQEMLAGSGKGIDGLLANFPFRPVRPPEHRYSELLSNPTLFDAVRKMREHAARTGHKAWDLCRK